MFEIGRENVQLKIKTFSRPISNENNSKKKHKSSRQERMITLYFPFLFILPLETATPFIQELLNDRKE